MHYELPEISQYNQYRFCSNLFLLSNSFAINNINLSKDTGNFLILLGFILLALSLMDWYLLYFSNKMKSIIYNFSLFSIVAIITVLFASILSGYSFKQLALLSNPEQWSNYTILFRVYIVSFGIALISILSVPRLVLIKTITKQPLPQYGSSI